MEASDLLGQIAEQLARKDARIGQLEAEADEMKQKMRGLRGGNDLIEGVIKGISAYCARCPQRSSQTQDEKAAFEHACTVACMDFARKRWGQQ